MMQFKLPKKYDLQGLARETKTETLAPETEKIETETFAYMPEMRPRRDLR